MRKTSGAAHPLVAGRRRLKSFRNVDFQHGRAKGRNVKAWPHGRFLGPFPAKSHQARFEKETFNAVCLRAVNTV